jgi:hypothetical protein
MSKFNIGRFAFATKKQAQADIRAILRGTQPGTSLFGEPLEKLLALLALHPRADQKTGCGVAQIRVEMNDGGPGFWLVRTDGTRTDFSYLKCFSAGAGTKPVQSAFRNAIRPQVDAFRSSCGEPSALMLCPVSGDLITLADAHVDHQPEFAAILNKFLQDEGVAVPDVSVVGGNDGDTAWRIDDEAFLLRWQEFHKANAGLRLVSRRANLSILRKASK